MNYTVTKDEFIISTDTSKIDIDFVHSFLTTSYWSPGIERDKVKRAMENSLTFALYKNDKQIGYARMITDKTSFAYLADVFINENYRGKGLGKWMIESILAHHDLQDLRSILLATRDAHKLYERFGFVTIPNPERFMIYKPAVTKNK